MMDRAAWHESMLYLVNRPLITMLLAGIEHGGKVVKIPHLGYIVNDPKIATAILKDGNAFTSAGQGSFGALITAVLGERALINMDDPGHRELRQKLTGLFSARYLDLLLNEATPLVLSEMQSALENGEQIDLVAYMRMMTNRVTCHMLGAHVDNHLAITDVITRLISLLTLTKLNPSPADLVQARAYYSELMAFADNSLFDAKHDDHSLIQQLRGLGMSQDEIKGLVCVMLVGGTETVSVSLPRIVALLLDSGQFGDLIECPELLPAAIDEGLRIIAPSPAILRGIVRHTTIDGYTFKAGERVMLLLPTILRRESYFEIPPAGISLYPRKFDIQRAARPAYRHLWFGAGAHFCIGYALAQREIESVLRLLMALPGRLRIVRRRYPRGQSFPTYHQLILELER